MGTLPPVQEMERAYLANDASYDGIFFLAVRTTGVFCRPSCPARKPLSENVSYFASVKEALFAGYRPCKRCRPLDALGAPPEWASRFLAKVEEDPAVRWTDAALRAEGIAPARARRFFLKQYGMTFQAYCRGRRLGKAFDAIRDGEELDEVILSHGYESHSGFRTAFGKAFGCPPGQNHDGGCVRLAWVETPLGPLVAGATEEGICLLEFTGRRMLEAQFATLKRLMKCPLLPGRNAHTDKLEEELRAYFAGELKAFTVPLVFPGSPFQRKVWEALLGIPYGQTRGYGELARELGIPGGSRAVGHANGLNRISILIPCHRVLDASGALGGYGGGLWRKRILLDLERDGIAPWNEASQS